MQDYLCLCACVIAIPLLLFSILLYNLFLSMGNQPFRIPGPNNTLYEGDCNKDGKPHGQGVMKYGDNCSFKGTFQNGLPVKGKFTYQNGDTYEGDIKSNKPEGTGIWKDKSGTYKGLFIGGEFKHGQIQYSDGSQYNGYLQSGQKHGVNSLYVYKDGDKFVGEFYRDNFKKGVYTTKDGSTYNGQFQSGLKHGEGQLTIKNKLKYLGTFYQDKFNGKGRLENYQQNYLYEGDFILNKKEGQGVLIDEKNKSRYVGDFKDNQKHGQGHYQFGNRKYDGSFQFGKFNGDGKLIYSNGDYYIGQFKDNKKHGKGKLFLDSIRQSYEGDFFNDIISGLGQIRYSNGDIYNGQFKNNKKDGRGEYVRANGHVLLGTWQNDIKSGNFIEKDPNSRTRIEGQYINDEKHGQFRVIPEGGDLINQIWKVGVKQYD